MANSGNPQTNKDYFRKTQIAYSVKNSELQINGFSDLMVEVFGERGKHARSAVGMASLPRGITVEVELIVEIEE